MFALVVTAVLGVLASALLPKLLSAPSGWSLRVPGWLAFIRLAYVRAAGGALFGVAMPVAISLGLDNLSHRPMTYVIWYGLAFVGMAVAIATTIVIDRRSAHAQVRPVPGPESELRALRVIREMFEHAERRKRDLVEAEFVAMIDEGQGVQGNAFSGNPQWGDFAAWRDPIAEFIGTVLGATQRQQILEIGRDQPDVRSQIGEVLDWLRSRRDQPETWEAQLSGLDGPELEAAIKARRDGLPLTTQIDNMIREGMELVSELSTPVQPEKTAKGWKIEGGGPSAEQQEKTDAFRQRAGELLERRNPALLADYREGCNDYIRRASEDGEASDRSADRRSDAEKMLALASAERRTAAWEVEVCLEGLARARAKLFS